MESFMIFLLQALTVISYILWLSLTHNWNFLGFKKPTDKALMTLLHYVVSRPSAHPFQMAQRRHNATKIYTFSRKNEQKISKNLHSNCHFWLKNSKNRVANSIFSRFSLFNRNKIPNFEPLDSVTLPVDQRTRADLFFIIEVWVLHLVRYTLNLLLAFLTKPVCWSVEVWLLQMTLGLRRFLKTSVISVLLLICVQWSWITQLTSSNLVPLLKRHTNYTILIRNWDCLFLMQFRRLRFHFVLV